MEKLHHNAGNGLPLIMTFNVNYGLWIMWGIENEPIATAARIQAYVDTKVPEVALRICLKRLRIPGPQEIHDLMIDYIYVERHAFHLDQITKEQRSWRTKMRVAPRQ